MITQIFITNLILVASAMFADIAFKLKLEETKLNPLLCTWLLITGISIVAYAIYLVWM